ncbi:hypothetical protein TNCV_4369331 [Trichonephila clavipes]|nr:hypothetical protein TNCV_4369331 [Trichonephila clavipes]
MTPELAPPLLNTTPHQREDVLAFDRFNVHRCPTRRVFRGSGLEILTCLPLSDTLTTGLPQPQSVAKSPSVAEQADERIKKQNSRSDITDRRPDLGLDANKKCSSFVFYEHFLDQ